MSTVTDVLVENHGSIQIVQPLTPRAWEWTEQHVQYESWQMIGGGVAVDPRMIDEIVQGMTDDDLVVQT